MALRRHVVPVTVDASGDAEVLSPVLSGRLISIRYLKTDYAGDDLAFTITSNATGETLWAEEDVAASATRHPRAPAHGVDGSASDYEAEEGEPVLVPIALSQDKIKIVVAGAGNATSGTFHFTLDD